MERPTRAADMAKNAGLITRVSWSGWFANRVRLRRFILSHDPWNQHNWARVVGSLPVELPKLSDHAPWLNGDAIAYRRAINAERTDGVFTH